MSDIGKARVDLAGVPETMLWPLWNRAAEHGRADRLIDDPMAADLAARIDYDFAAMFGRPSVFHAIRARYCDDLIRRHLARHPQAAVVSLGEGLETQYWRVGYRGPAWVTVDVPKAIAVREQLLPPAPHAIPVARSALDPAWMDAVPETTAPPFVTAAGLLMYFQEAEVRDLLRRVAVRFPGATVFFDTVPPYFSRRTLKGFKVTPRYQAPPMPWGISFAAIPAFAVDCGLRLDSVRTFAEPFSSRTPVLQLASKLPFVRDAFAPCLVCCVGDRV